MVTVVVVRVLVAKDEVECVVDGDDFTDRAVVKELPGAFVVTNGRANQNAVITDV